MLFAQYLKKSKLFEYSNQILEKKRATKFLLLTFVYLFVLLSLVDAYSAFLELENNENFYNGFFNQKDADKRIIVKTASKINIYDAVDVTYGLGYAFVQFDNAESAEKALNQYNE